VRPVPGAIESGFGWRKLNSSGSSFHPGVDLQAAWGSPVSVCGNGDVVAAGWDGGYGNRVIVQHAGSLSTVYAHLSQITVFEGQRLAAGSQVGLVGATGQVTGPHLHFEVRDNGSPIDPAAVLALVPAR
jgi:murein DD-endopeptidase MepM/ murein hydrolase activator NlpD